MARQHVPEEDEGDPQEAGPDVGAVDLPGQGEPGEGDDRPDEEEGGHRRPQPVRLLVLEDEREEGPPIAAAVPEMPEIAPAMAELRLVSWMSRAVTEASTVTRMRMPTVRAMTSALVAATRRTPRGVTSTRAPRAQPRCRQAMARGPVASCSSGRAKTHTSSEAGMRSGRARTTKGAATTEIPKPIVDWTIDPSATATPRRSRVGSIHSVTGRTRTSRGRRRRRRR